MAVNGHQSSSMDPFARALESNKSWSSSIKSSHPDLLPTLSQGQKPGILWLGCSDSRCPETTILGLQPGDVFVHRNIANVIHPGDLSVLSVIAYAVGALKVEHVIVCGHTSCGGAAAALGNQSLGVLDAWLTPLKQLRAKHAAAWQKAGLGEKERAAALVEANVKQGVEVVKQNPAVVQAVKERGLKVHGLVYDISQGLVRELPIEDDEESIRTRTEAFSLS